MPAAHEATLVRNLHRHNTRGVVLSWSNAKAGKGHVHPLGKRNVNSIMQAWNYTEDAAASMALQQAATYHWFKEHRVHGKPGGGVRVWRRKMDPSSHGVAGERPRQRS